MVLQVEDGLRAAGYDIFQDRPLTCFGVTNLVSEEVSGCDLPPTPPRLEPWHKAPGVERQHLSQGLGVANREVMDSH